MILILGNCFSSCCAWLLLFSFVRSRSDTIVKKELRSENRKKRNSCTSDDEEIQNTSVVKQYLNKMFWKFLKSFNFQTLLLAVHWKTSFKISKLNPTLQNLSAMYLYFVENTNTFLWYIHKITRHTSGIWASNDTTKEICTTCLTSSWTNT